MIKKLEQELRNLQKELAGIMKEQAALRFQPCRGDSEITKKDEKLEEMDRRAKNLQETIRDRTRKQHLMIFESISGRIYDVHSSEKRPCGFESSGG